MPIEPVSIEASSERMSPNMLPVTITSNCAGFLTSCIAAVSTYMCVSSTAAYSLPTVLTTSRHSCEVSSTFALSTEHSLLLRFSAARKRSEEHTSELQSHHDLVCRLLLEKKKQIRQSRVSQYASTSVV